jgi:predicted PurR-regulated permease PerM
MQLAHWPFDSGPVDRLAILRNVVARSLRSKDPEANYKAFTERIDDLLSEAQWHHQIVLDEKIDHHFDRVQSASEYITSIVREISQRIDTLTQGLTNALLGAIGVIVLTLLTALAQDDLSESILRLGMWAYAVYLVLFPGAYRLSSIWSSQSLLESEIEQQRKQFDRQLGREKVDEMMKPVTKRKAAFRFWLVLTAAIFFIVAVVIVMGGNQLPSYLIGN